MGQVIIRNLDDAVSRRHRERARARGVSMEQQLRDVLAKAADADRDAFLTEMRRIRSANRPPPSGRSWPTAEAMVREDRDTR